MQEQTNPLAEGDNEQTTLSTVMSWIIEDNAHGFLSNDEKGVCLGSRTDIGLLSIRKSAFLPNGAAMIINNKKKLFYF